MPSIADLVEPKRRADERIVVRLHENGASIGYYGEDPDTRYLPRPRPLFRKLVERFVVGVLGPTSLRWFGP